MLNFSSQKLNHIALSFFGWKGKGVTSKYSLDFRFQILLFHKMYMIHSNCPITDFQSIVFPELSHIKPANCPVSSQQGCTLPNLQLTVQYEHLKI